MGAMVETIGAKPERKLDPTTPFQSSEKSLIITTAGDNVIR